MKKKNKILKLCYFQKCYAKKNGDSIENRITLIDTINKQVDMKGGRERRRTKREREENCPGKNINKKNSTLK